MGGNVQQGLDAAFEFVHGIGGIKGRVRPETPHDLAVTADDVFREIPFDRTERRIDRRPVRTGFRFRHLGERHAVFGRAESMDLLIGARGILIR